MALSKDEIIEAIKSMSVLELSELSKELQSVFGVSAAAPVMMAGGPSADAAAAAPPEDEAPTSFDVVLTGFGEKKIKVIKVVREITGLGLTESKDLVEGVPSKVKEGLNDEDAKAIAAKLIEEGATVEIKPSSS